MRFGFLSPMLSGAASSGLLVLTLSFPATGHTEGPVTERPAPTGSADSPTTAAETGSELTLRRATSLALVANPEITALAKEVGALGGAATQSGLWRNPELAIETEDLGASRVEGVRRFTTIRLDQLIETGGKREARVTAVSLAREVARQDYEAARIDVRARVAAAFADVLAAQVRTELAEEGIRLASDIAAATSRRVQAGRVAPVEAIKANGLQALSRIESEQARRELTASRKRLALLWGSPAPRFLRAVGDIGAAVALPPFETLAQQIRNAPVAVRWAKAVEQRRALLELERARRIPDITVSAGIRRYAQFGDNGALLGVAVPLPVFDRNQGNLREALLRVDKAEDERRADALRQQADLVRTYETLLAVQSEIGVLRDEVLPGAGAVFRATYRGYELGKFGSLEMLDAHRTLVQNQMLHLRRLLEYRKLIIEVERLVAAPLDDVSAAANDLRDQQP